MNIKHIQSKQLLTKSKLPDADYVINPYIGCSHACAYCYAEFMSRFTGHIGEQWGSFIDIKECETIKIPRDIKGKTILLGSATDPYNHLEKQYRKTRQILETLQHTDASIEILTKSPLVLRDIDILKTMPDIRVGISLAILDRKLSRLMEPFVPPPQKRLEAIRALHDNGIAVYAFISPIFPFLTDPVEIAQKVSPYVELTCFENLNLRAAYKHRVLELIQKNYPAQYELFSGVYSSPATFRSYWTGEAKRIEKAMRGQPHKLYFFHDEIKKR